MAKRPNIILITTDQQRADTIGALGAPYMETPVLDRLVEEGVSFTNAYCTAPSCVPSRASLFTGYYPHNTNVLSNGDEWSPTWVQMLADSGYQCVNIGKMHTVPADVDGGFHERFIVENKDRGLKLDNHEECFYDEWDKYLAHEGVEKPSREGYKQLPEYDEALGAFKFPIAEKYHSDVFVGNMALWWLKRRESTAPLFLEIGFPGPHPPYDPTERFIDLYQDSDISVPEVSEEEIAKQPPPQHIYRDEMINPQAPYVPDRAGAGHDAVQWVENPSDEQLQRLRAYYYANVSMIDEKIGQIMEILEEKGYLENSVVIFTSDHGDALGDHGHIQKWTMYDCSTRVPLVVRCPDRFPEGKKVDGLVQQFDLAPAILELAGVDIPAKWDAESILPQLEGKTTEGREYVFAEHGKDWKEFVFTGTELMTMVRSKKWKLVHYLGEDYGELYDLVSDPEEKVNLWDDPEHKLKKEELLKVLMDWRIESEYRAGPSTIKR